MATLSGDIGSIKSGIEMLAKAVRHISLSTIALIIAFTQAWKLSLIFCIIFTPIQITVSLVTYYNEGAFFDKLWDTVVVSQSIANEVIRAIKLVRSTNSELLEETRYQEQLEKIWNVNFRRSLYMGLSEGSILF
jgi:ABC-type multidrug transport system fused ATPase/permease subunit